MTGSADGNSRTPNWALNACAASLNSLAECWIEKTDDRIEIRIVEIFDDAERVTA